MTKITDVEASLEQFKLVSLAYQKETSNRFHRMQESIEKNKADADKQFSELLQLLKALQPPTTLPTTIPRFEENSRQCFSSDEVEKEELILMSMNKGDVTGLILAVKEDLWQKLIDDLDEPLMVHESDGVINKNEFAVVAPVVAVAPIVVAPIAVAPVAPVVVTPVEPSFVPLGRKIKQNQAEQKLGCEICLQEPVPTQRRTWDPGITQYDVLKQHLEDKLDWKYAAASAFGEQHKLAPMAEDRKRRWRREVGWILSMTGYIIEFVPSQQTSKDRSNMELDTIAIDKISQLGIALVLKL
ncbi:Rho guanine nucleotide exchange factor 8-like protein [Tanacetum coccineum]